MGPMCDLGHSDFCEMLSYSSKSPTAWLVLPHQPCKQEGWPA